MTAGDLKSEVRKAAMARRRTAWEAADRDRAADLLGEVLAAHRGRALSGYLPIRTEIDPRPAMAEAARSGPVGVPVIEAPATPLRFRTWWPDSLLKTGPFGARVPVAGDWVVPELVIVPLLAFDRSGQRLGYGGGFYDRTLELLRAAGSVTAIGFAFADQEMETVPTEPTDAPLDLLVTEREIIAFDPPGQLV